MTLQHGYIRHQCQFNMKTCCGYFYSDQAIRSRLIPLIFESLLFAGSQYKLPNLSFFLAQTQESIVKSHFLFEMSFL